MQSSGCASRPKIIRMNSAKKVPVWGCYKLIVFSGADYAPSILTHLHMNKCLIIIVIVAVIILSSCRKEDSLTAPSTVTGKFIVDSIGTLVVVKTDTITKNLQTFVIFSLVYHFENYPGMIENISVSMANSYGVMVFIDYAGPESVNDLHRYKDSYEFPDALNGQDSVKIFRGLNGAFLTKDANNAYVLVNNFSWNDSLFVRIER
jgi:hypothetical protein